MLSLKSPTKQIIIILIIMFILYGCDSGWSISGWEIK
jgi:hypothetical protein